MPDIEAFKARIAKAAGARQEREYGPKKTRRRRSASERLACGCLPEHEEQRALVSAARRIGLTLFWSRAERRESVRLRAWAAARGALDGMPDLFVLELPGVAVELKARCKKHRLSRRQEQRIAWLRENGWRVIVAHGAEQALSELGKLWPAR